ncbi:MAG TPA: HAD hydrolase-like protein [Flavobacteriaceae bacterium]|nr:HAD hydrolase-like protein [Flavobacteriaceae bacterium]
MINLNTKTKFRNIFFDFDGVIAESVSAKTDAFKEMYLPYGVEIANQVVDYHIKNGGVSRFDKFRYWEKKFFDKDISDTDMQKLALDFSNLVLNRVINADEVLGANDFIKKYAKRMNFWIITGTPTKEIEIIAQKRNISEYFIGIHGSPNNKRYWTEYLISKHELKRKETLFLGDATTDFDAANFSNIHFGLRRNHQNKELFKEFKGLSFDNFNSLEKLIKNNI